MYKLLILILFSGSLYSNIRNRIQNIDVLNNNIITLKQQIKNSTGRKQRRKLEKQLEETESNLLNIVSDTSLFETKPREREKPNILDEVHDILNPVISNLKRLSSKPRQIEKLKIEIPALHEKLRETKKGISNIEKLLETKEAKHLHPALTNARKKFINIKQDLELKIDLLEKQLNELSETNISVFDSVKTTIKEILSTKGKNLLLGILCFIIVFIFFQILRKLVFRTRLFFKPKFQFLKKTFTTLYGIVTIILSTISGILCLYFLNDWFLFTVAILAILGILWSSKQLLPKIIRELRMILNLGSVRENERIIWQECPWLVKKIGFRCTLVNPALEGGILKLSIDKITGLYSRNILDNEPWFPTKKNDWVILSDNTYGKVVLQTPEQIILELIGKTKKYYKLSDFLNLQPKNLSEGFEAVSIIGIDYAYQKEIFKTIEIFKKEFALNEFPFEDCLIELNDAGAHSLNILVRLFFSGTSAQNYYQIHRLMQSKLVTICNKNNLDIPFEQLTVHINKQ